MTLLSRTIFSRASYASWQALGAVLLLVWGGLGCSGTIASSAPGGTGGVGHPGGTGGAGNTGNTGAGGGTGGAGGGMGGAGGGTGGTAGCDASVFGKNIHCEPELAACCTAQGGVQGDTCMFGLDCTDATIAAVCYPPLSAPAADEFPCDYFNCKVGQVCMVPIVAGDGCWMHACKTPPAPCDGTPTCACLQANALLGTTPPWGDPGECAEDASGNVRVHANLSW